MADHPIDEAMPEIRGAAYVQVREWDTVRMRLAHDYEAADGEYLKQIRDALKAHSGLWQAYLVTRGLSYQEAMARIHLAEARQRVMSHGAGAGEITPRRLVDHRALMPSRSRPS